MRINKLTAIVLAGAISMYCTSYGLCRSDTSAAVDQAVEMLQRKWCR